MDRAWDENIDDNVSTISLDNEEFVYNHKFVPEVRPNIEYDNSYFDEPSNLDYNDNNDNQKSDNCYIEELENENIENFENFVVENKSNI